MSIRQIRVLAAATLLAALPGCACGWWRPESERSLAFAERVFVGRTAADAEATRRTFTGISDWVAADFRNSRRSLRATYDLYTDCPEGDPPPAK